MGAIHGDFAGAGPTEEGCVCGRLEGQRNIQREESGVGRGVGEVEETGFGGWVEEAQAV